MWPFNKTVFVSADEAISEASKYSNRNNWRKAYKVYAEAISQLGEELSAKDEARLHHEKGIMARNIAVDIFNSGDRYGCRDWFREARSEYELAMELEPAFWRPWFALANLFARDENLYKKALPYYDKAVDLNPQHAEIYNNRGLTYEALGDVDEALRNFEMALGVDPTNSDARDNIAAIKGGY